MGRPLSGLLTLFGVFLSKEVSWPAFEWRVQIWAASTEARSYDLSSNYHTPPRFPHFHLRLIVTVIAILRHLQDLFHPDLIRGWLGPIIAWHGPSWSSASRLLTLGSVSVPSHIFHRDPLLPSMFSGFHCRASSSMEASRLVSVWLDLIS